MKRDEYPFQDAAEVVVGSEKVKFLVPIEVVCDRSKFFKSAFSPAWRDDKKPIDLSDADPQTFSDYLQVLYQGATRFSDDITGTFIKLIRLYSLSDKLGDLQSANIVIDNIIKYSDREQEAPSAACVKFAMKKTPENSPLRRLLVDYYVHELCGEWFSGTEEDLPKRFLRAVTIEFMKTRGSEDVPILANERPTCHYHQHDESCPECEDGESDEDD